MYVSTETENMKENMFSKTQIYLFIVMLEFYVTKLDLRSHDP